jgi:DNA-binding winged helix-turn-helix (wHTH) protein/TolB-like protein
MNEPPTNIYEFGEFRLCAAKRLLARRDGETVPLKPKVFETLLYLVQNSGKVLEKDELLSAVWTDTIVEENNLSQNISILRRVFGEKSGEHRFIVTVPGHGYKFVADVILSEPQALAHGSNPAELQISDDKLQIENKSEDNLQNKNQSEIAKNQIRNPQSAIPNRKRLVVIIIAAVAGLSFLGFYSWRGNWSDVPIKTIAVLPFKPLLAENRNEALELGMADTLINKISSSDEIIVRPLGSVRRFNNLEQDVLQAGRELGVDSVLEGTIQTSGDRIRIAARIVRTGDGKQLWTETFDEKFTDIFAVQDSISNKVLSALALKLSRDAQKRLTKHNTENVEAYQLYMKRTFSRFPSDFAGSHKRHRIL